MAKSIILWPVAIVEDRYEGTYSGGRWLAVGGANVRDGYSNNTAVTRLDFIMGDEGEESPFGGDFEACAFWTAPPDWIAVGDTPNEALANLYKKFGVTDA